MIQLKCRMKVQSFVGAQPRFILLILKRFHDLLSMIKIDWVGGVAPVRLLIN